MNKRILLTILEVITIAVGIIAIYCFCNRIWDSGSVSSVVCMWGICAILWWKEMWDEDE